MRYKQFGKTDMNVSSLCIGTWAIGGAYWGDVNKKDSIDAIHAMIDNGCNFIDTAPAYNGGESERVVGEALKGRRDKMFIATKAVSYTPPEGGYAKDGSREHIFKQCEESLKNLQTDYIDYYMVHWPDPEIPVEETYQAYADLQKQGKVRWIGVSNFSKEEILRVEKIAPVYGVQMSLSMVDRTYDEYLQWAAGKGIASMTYGSLGGGILTGTFRTLPQLAEDDSRMLFYDSFKEPKFSKVQELLKVMDGIAQAHNVAVAQVAINWNTQKNYVSTSIVGVRNPHEAEINCAAMAWSLSDDEMKTLDDAIATYLD